MKPRINIITLGVADLDRSTHFYQELFGISKMPMPGNISFFELNGTWLSLYNKDLLAEDAEIETVSNQEFRSVTLAHNVASKNEVKEVMNMAEKVGARIVKKPKKADWGGFSGYFADPDNHIWEVAYNPFFWPGPKE